MVAVNALRDARNAVLSAEVVLQLPERVAFVVLDALHKDERLIDPELEAVKIGGTAHNGSMVSLFKVTYTASVRTGVASPFLALRTLMGALSNAMQGVHVDGASGG